MITRIRVPAPMPEAVAVLVEAHLPKRVRAADAAAGWALREFRRYRCEMYGEDREDALSVVHRANKILAAYNPGLRVTLGGAR